MIRLGIIGYGYWGPKLARNFQARADCRLEAVADTRPESRAQIAAQCPQARIFEDGFSLLATAELDAVAIATPVHSHYELAKAALEKGLHVLLEKPMTASLAEADALIRLADEKGKVLLVDHTFLYTGAVRKIRSMIESGTIGRLQYFDSTRINLGAFQPDVNVLWDLASHDIAILNYLTNERPVRLQASGISHTHNGIENIAYLILYYTNDLIAHFNCSWSSPVKIRLMLIGGDKQTIVYNDLEPTEKLKVYDTGARIRTDEERNRILVDYRVGDIYVPRIPANEALADVTADFLDAIRLGTRPVSDAQAGRAVVRVLEAAQRSLEQNGAMIEIAYDDTDN